MSATRSLYRPGTHSPGRRMRGVSLLEMLLVVGLIAAASLLAAAAFTGGFAGAQLRSSAKEIAAQLGIKPVSVRVRLGRLARTLDEIFHPRAIAGRESVTQ